MREIAWEAASGCYEEGRERSREDAMRDRVGDAADRAGGCVGGYARDAVRQTAGRKPLDSLRGRVNSNLAGEGTGLRDGGR
eukprot:6182767-Pleurochrysis_carterae.AAC.5